MCSDLNAYHYQFKSGIVKKGSSYDRSIEALRETTLARSAEKLKASHARELVAAFFGYKSHAALIAEEKYPLDRLEEASIFIPDTPLMEMRRARLDGLPSGLMPSLGIAQSLSDFLIDEGLFGGEVWLYDTLESYITEVLLVGCQDGIDDDLSGIMAATNASFFEPPEYEDVNIQDKGDELVITAKAEYKGEPLDEKPFCGDIINMAVRVSLPRIAGKRGFHDFELEAGGKVNNDWFDPETEYDVPNVRPKDQWLEMTGGFRFGESPEQLQSRLVEMHAIRNRLAKGKALKGDLERLSHLTGDEDESF